MCPCSWTGPRRPGSQLHAVVFPFLHQRAYRPVAGIFRKHCQQVPSRDICKKFFSILPDIPLPGIRSSSHAPAREKYRPPANVLSLPVRIRQYPLRASSPVSPLSSPLVKQRGAAPPASCRQAPHELRPLPQRQIPQNALPLRQSQARSTIPASIKISSQQDRQWSHARGPYAPGCPGMVDEREQQLLRGPSRSGGSPPANPLALTRTKVFAGMGARGKGSLFQKASLPPDGPLSSNNKTGPSSLPPPPLLLPLAFRAQIGQRCGQQKEMA